MPLPASERRWQLEPTTRIAWSMASAAAALLLIGLLFYLTFRSALPVLLHELHVSPFPTARHIPPGLFVGSFPNLIHVAAFALMTCALLPPKMFSVVAASSFWVAVDIFWEVGCNHPLVRAAYRLFHITAIPACTTDRWDVVASLAGAATAIAIAFLILKLHSAPSAPARELQP